MGKKNRKNIAKKKQAKALKRRTEKKIHKKSTPKRKQPFAGNMNLNPGNLPPGAMKMMAFAEPIMLKASPDPSNMGGMQQIAALTQAFWKVYAEQDMEKRELQLGPLREAYEATDWADEEFDDFSEYMLKRHIYFLPESHTDEERAKYTAEELEAAAASVAEEMEAADAADRTLISVETVKDDPQPAKAITVDLELPAFAAVTFDASSGSAFLGEEKFNRLAALRDSLKDAAIKYGDDNDPAFNDVKEFHTLAIDLFVAYLKEQGDDSIPVSAHRRNATPLLNDFLVGNQGRNLLDFDADDLEEYMLDHYLRKLKTSSEREEQLVNSMRLFVDFAEKMGYHDNGDELRERIAEITDEYADLLVSERES